MRLPWLAGLAVCGCLSSDVSLSATEGEDEDTGDSEATTADTSTTTTTPASDTEDIPPSDCMSDAIRVATFNIETVGSTESDEFAALADTLYRIDADVVCMQEIGLGESGNLAALAEAAGYPHLVEAELSPAIGGEIHNACLGQVPITLVASYTGGELSPGFANDVGRDILVVRAEPTPGCYVGLFTVHLKSGGESVDLFRRQVEVERLTQAVDLYREQRSTDGLVLLGDFNEQTDDAALGEVFEAPPSGLPDSYTLGPDIELPLVYHPFARLEEVGFQRIEASWEDSTRMETWQEVARLDYVFIGQAMLAAAEVYNACEDNGVDDDPPGGRIEKRGDPLTCFTAATASDHIPVVADLVLP